MQVTCNGDKIKNMTFNGCKVNKWNHDNVTIFNAGTIAITYHVDSGVQYTEDRNNGDNSLSPNSFTPSKTGYDFVGWREDNTANSSVLTSKVVQDSPITLYAVFKKAITVTLYNGSTTATNKTDYQYYNNGNKLNAQFYLVQTVKSGWAERGWSTATTANGTVSYGNAVTIERDSNITLYGMYQQTITLTTVITGTTSNKTGTRYWNSGSNAYINPTFTVANPTKSGGTFLGWSTSASSATVSYSTISNLALSASIKIYSLFKFADVTVSPSASQYYKFDAWFGGTENQATIYSSVDTSKYYAAQLTLWLANSDTAHRGQQIQVYVSDGTNNTRIVYSYVDWTGNGQSYPNQGQNLNPTLTFSTSSGSKPIYLRTIATLYGGGASDGTIASYNVGVTSIKLLGRTSIG